MSDSKQRFNEIADKLEELSKDEKNLSYGFYLESMAKKMKNKFLKKVILLRITEKRSSIVICVVIVIIYLKHLVLNCGSRR